MLCLDSLSVLSAFRSGQPKRHESHRIGGLCQRTDQKFISVIWFLLNKCMNKNALTLKQHQINRHSQADSQATDDWIQAQGLSTSTFSTTPLRLLQAQHQAQQLITHHGNLLNSSQRQTLEQFMRQMSQPKTQRRLKASQANPILNIASKINRQLFRQHRQRNKA